MSRTSASDQARVYGEQAQDAVKQVKPFVEKSLKEQPMATLAGAAVLGFVLGALWKSRGASERVASLAHKPIV